MAYSGKSFDQMLAEVQPIKRRGRVRDLTSIKFGRLSVVCLLGTRFGEAAWHTKCDCDKNVIVSSQNLTSGRTCSCGCFSVERRPFVNLKHGDMRSSKRTVEYNCYQHIKNRCYCKTNHAYDRYGGRGITVCDRWLSGDGARTGFDCFLEDMGRRPRHCDSIDRYPDNDGNYEPGNCRWADSVQQGLNTRLNNIVSWNRREGLLTVFAREVGLDEEMVRRRVKNRGWSVERALSTPSLARDKG
ncbi:hypothetical protein NKJ09_23070 [Mesorhizobium sp. M0189]|uniref:hypothetical protein n=1 Tax=Mesorhizobium sp. M0189 TaxID=2956909 RepID=UPI00333881AC